MKSINRQPMIDEFSQKTPKNRRNRLVTLHRKKMVSTSLYIKPIFIWVDREKTVKQSFFFYFEWHDQKAHKIHSINQFFFWLNTNLYFYKLAPGESTKIRRAKVGQLLPLRGEPVSGWVSNTVRRLVVRLKSSLFLVQVYGAAKKHF